jgi:hypothetical protein
MLCDLACVVYRFATDACHFRDVCCYVTYVFEAQRLHRKNNGQGLALNR